MLKIISKNYKSVLLENIQGTLVIKLNRPKHLNALNKELMSEVLESLEVGDQDSAIRSFVITGGEKAFAAGADIKEMADLKYSDVLRESFL